MVLKGISLHVRQGEVVTLIGGVKHPKPTLTLIVKGTYDLVPDGQAAPSGEQVFPSPD